VGGIGAAAAAVAANGWHHGMMMMHGTESPADVAAHIDHFLKHFYVEIDATDAQKAKIGPLVQQAATDLLPMHTQLEAAHARVIQGMTQPTVDRAALEAARESHLQLADQASKRIVQLLGDVGDVLTPTQRSALATHLEQLHGMPHS
jgi:Spy/CpxP family protein refolding chaperone